MKAIVAHAKNRVIGKHNSLIWHIPEDLKFFKRFTIEHENVLFGRKTLESLGVSTLPGRNIFVLSRNLESCENYTVFNSVESALDFFKDKNVVIAGGEGIYELFLPYLTELYVTQVDMKVKGDAFFPEYEDQFSKREELLSGINFKTHRWVRN